LEKRLDLPKNGFDRINALIGAFVFIFTFIIYRITVAPTLSYWDCGEFLACSYILGIPHPPGSPVFIILGRLFSVLPIAADFCFRINIMSVISSCVAVLFGYLAVVRIIRFWYKEAELIGWKRIIPYLGGIIGAFCMAFAETYWSNSVEAEVYGLSMAIMTMILWLMLKFYECRGTVTGTKILIIACYLAMIGVGVHLSTFLILPVAAIFFILKKDAPQKAWLVLCALFVVELLSIMAFSNIDNGFNIFIIASIIYMLVTIFMIYEHINWPVLLGIGGFSLIMIGFYQFLFGVIGAAIVIIVIGSIYGKLDWKTGLVVLSIAVVGYSLHAFVPIRSAEKPRIDENGTSRDFKTFVSFLDRKQYGSQLMMDRAFERRGRWENQFGRHPHMGFWGYFEEQYGLTSVFSLVFLLGLFGVYFTARHKLEVGLPFLILLLLSTVGLVLYMNFADGMKYNPQTGDAYLEVRDRDYFFTPGFAFFGLALGLGAAALMELVRRKTASRNFHKPAMIAISLLVLLPVFAISSNYYTNDRSKNFYPLIYSQNMLQNCGKDAILFTSGDNDTFPLWCVQEVYNFRKDVRVVNLSLFNTDWYVLQMKNQYKVPISLNDDQILWKDYDFQGGSIKRPDKPFYDRPRKRRTYLIPMPYEGRTIKLQDMMVDEVVLENKWQNPIYFSSEPYAESPLKLRDISIADGVVYRIDTTGRERKIDAEHGYYLYKNVFRYDGLDNPNIYRDENATGVMLTLGFNALRLADEFRRSNQMDKAYDILHFIIKKYPEFLQAYQSLGEFYKREGDTAKADSLLAEAEKVISDLYRRNPKSQFYLSDLGIIKYYRGDIQTGLDLLWKAFNLNRNSSYGYHKLAQILYEARRMNDLISATRMHAEYGYNRSDPLVQQILGVKQAPSPNEP